MIRVIQVSNSLGIGGVEKNLQTITKSLSSTFDVAVCAIHELGLRGEALVRDGHNVVCLNGDIKTFGKVLREFDPDVVMIHRAGKEERNWNKLIEFVAARKDRVLIEHNVFGLVDDGPADRHIDLHLHKSITSYIKFLSSAGRIGYDRTDRHTVLYNSLDIESIRRNKPTRNDSLRLRKRHGIEADDFLILRVGRSDFTKWGDVLTLAVPLVLKRIPNARFLLLGAPPSRQKYLEKHYGDKVVCLQDGMLDEKVTELYFASDLLLHSSRIGESFGYAIAEAMASGLPVIVNSTPWADNAQIELVEHMVTGLVANTPEAMAEAADFLERNGDLRRAMAFEAERRDSWSSTKCTSSLARLIVEQLKLKGVNVGEYDTMYQDSERCPTDDDIANYVRDYPNRLKRSWKCIPPSRDVGRLSQRAMWHLWDLRELATKWARRFHT